MAITKKDFQVFDLVLPSFLTFIKMGENINPLCINFWTQEMPLTKIPFYKEIKRDDKLGTQDILLHASC